MMYSYREYNCVCAALDQKAAFPARAFKREGQHGEAMLDGPTTDGSRWRLRRCRPGIQRYLRHGPACLRQGLRRREVGADPNEEIVST